MKKNNKKGFTLIEMLVVIAIIAVLVAIIIPTVTSSTGKAQAAANAANLRSVKAELTTDFLSGTLKPTKASGEFTSGTFEDITTQVNTYSSDVSFKSLTGGTGGFKCEFDGTEFRVTYDGHTINDWATYAEKAEFPTVPAGG